VKRLLVTGSRTWTDTDLIRVALRAAMVSLAVPEQEITLVHGGAHGADQLAGQVGRQLGMRIEVREAQWRRCTDACIHDLRAAKSYCPEAGYRRNVEMIVSMEPGSLMLTFAAKVPSGTSGCAQVARRCGLDVVDWGDDTTVDRRRLVDQWVQMVHQIRAGESTYATRC
jgi:YspA, cpYpsA-related SLOG family